MARVISSATMSLDGFIAHPDDRIDGLFDWYDAGEVHVPTANPGVGFHLTPTSADHWRRFTAGVGALVVGRRLFDLTDGWGGRHPLGVPVVVLTHAAPSGWSPEGAEDFSFVTTGIRDAIARAAGIAGDRVVAVAAGTVAGQALDAGLLDAVAVDLAPVVLGTGKRYFGDRDLAGVALGDPTVVPAHRVTHLQYEVLRG
jgi:dihydrofolate reductase